MLLSNLNELKNDMVSKKWTICSFLFRYKSVVYIVLVKRFVGKEKRVNQYALVKLHFMKRDDLNDGLEIEANSSKILIDAKTLRQYFGIEYQDNLGDILKQFTETFGKAIPMNIPKNISDEEKGAMVKSLSISDSEDPNKIYCYKIKRNPNGGKRSDFNSDKTKLLRLVYLENLRMNLALAFAILMIRLKKMMIQLFYTISQNSLFSNAEQMGIHIHMNYNKNSNK